MTFAANPFRAELRAAVAAAQAAERADPRPAPRANEPPAPPRPAVSQVGVCAPILEFVR